MQGRSQRYEIQRPVEYRIDDSMGPIITGSGYTPNISCNGILFRTKGPLNVDRRIELVVRMEPPFQVDLMGKGMTVRSRDDTVAVAIRQYRLRPSHSGPAGSDSELSYGSTGKS